MRPRMGVPGMSRDSSRLSTRHRGDLARELESFFLEDPGAMSSNFRGIAALALSGVRTDGGNARGGSIAADRMIAIRGAIRHDERVRIAFLSLSEGHREVLWFALGTRTDSSDVRKALDGGVYKAAAAVLTDAARKACKAAAGAKGEPTREQIASWLERACVMGDGALKDIAEERDKLVDEALAAYAEARGEIKRTKADDSEWERCGL